MNLFRAHEEVRIGPHASNAGRRGTDGKVIRAVESVLGMNRYIVEFPDGERSIFLEATLQMKRSDWGMLRGIWQPRRETR
jgi:hypothetical protein